MPDLAARTTERLVPGAGSSIQDGRRDAPSLSLAARIYI